MAKTRKAENTNIEMSVPSLLQIERQKGLTGRLNIANEREHIHDDIQWVAAIWQIA